jgi:hypothetical protein
MAIKRPIPRPAHVTDEMLDYLDTMRDARLIPNMFSSYEQLQPAFGLDEDTARAVMYYWSESMPQRDPVAYAALGQNLS